jgi:hypothetical protein
MCAVSLRTIGINTLPCLSIVTACPKYFARIRSFCLLLLWGVRTGQPFLDFVPNPHGMDVWGFAIFAGDKEFGAIPHSGTDIRRNS